MRSLSCAALLALLLAACGTSYTSTRVADPVLVAKSDSPAEVRAAVVRALAARKFIAKSEEPGKIVAELDRGSEKLVVAVEYSSTQYLVRYVSSSGLKTKPGPGGDLLVDEHWAGWVKGLKSRIGEELLAPAKEAAETAKRERDYQLMIEQNRTAQAQANAQAAQAQAPGNPQPTAPAPAPAAPGIVPGVIQPMITLPLPTLPVPAGNMNVQHSTTSGSATITCCINGAFFVCPNQEALKKCMSLGPHECRHEPGKCK
jgi:hypothetical protein